MSLFKSIPEYKELMKKQRTVRRDRYNFGNCISYFKGGGTRPTSKSAQVVFIDEIDDFTEYEGRIRNCKRCSKKNAFIR